MFQHRRWAFAGILVVLCLIVGPALFLFALKSRQESQRVESMNNLREIGRALHAYESALRHFPAGTRPNEILKNPEDRLSWLVEILPQLELEKLQQLIDDVGSQLYVTTGLNLVYELDGEPKDSGTISRMIETIRLRIDPVGDRKIQIRQVDKNRVELIIPLDFLDETFAVDSIVKVLNTGALEVPLKQTPVSELVTAVTVDEIMGFSDEAYQKHFQHRLKVFLDPGQMLTPDPNGYGPTTYVGMAGVGKDAATLKIDDPKAGIFGYDRQTKAANIKDGLSNTMMVTEVYQDLGPWGRGGRATIRGLTAKPYINGPDGIGSGKGSGGVHVLLADGSVRLISENIQPEVFEALATMAGGEDVGDF